MNYNTILPPFKWFVLQNFPYIEDDFDALTNWQLFCKLGKEMNKIIEKTNLTGEQVENLTNAFNELKAYVDNYFENLDIQEEIDNKLDEMAESGELADIIAQYIQLQGILAYNSVSAMKSAENLVEGSFARTYGYYSYNDGGGAFYKVRQVTNQDVEDNSYIIALHDTNLVAELIIGDKLNVKTLGAKGDGETDDIDFINKALEKIDDYSIYLPKGNYLVSETIDLDYNNKTNILFDASEGIITYSGTDYAISCGGITYSTFKFSKIIAPNGGCIKWHGETSGYEGNHSEYNHIDFEELQADTNCIYLSRTDGWVNEFVVNGGRFTSGDYGIYFEIDSTVQYAGIGGWKFYNVGFEGVTNGVMLDANNNQIEDIHFINPRYAEFYQEQYNKLITTQGVVKNCSFDANGVGVSVNMNKMTFSTDTDEFRFNCGVQYKRHGEVLKTTYDGGVIHGGMFVPNDSKFAILNGYMSVIPENDNLNNYNYPGTYAFESLTSCTNIPSDIGSWENAYGGRMFVFSMSPRYDGYGTTVNVMQVLVSGGGQMFIRYIHGSTAGTWAKITP